MAALALFITFGLNTLRPHIARAVMDATGRELRIDGPLKPVWSWPPFRPEAPQPTLLASRTTASIPPSARWSAADSPV